MSFDEMENGKFYSIGSIQDLTPESYYDRFMQGLIERNPNELEFHQAVGEVVKTLIPFVLENKQYLEARILERITEPDRVLSFRVCWEDDQGNIRVNRGHRVQFNNTIGPYKGGLRFHPSVNISILKFLGFEQIFKNSLTSLPIGGGKGGANFNPKGKSDREIMRFCQSFMTELSRHVGEDIDIPAGDIGVGEREISYMFAHYKRMQNKFVGVLTGKGIGFGGSLVRKEATGHGLIYFANNVLVHHGHELSGSNCIVSGSGNVAQFAAEKLIHYGAKVIAMSDSGGTLLIPEGVNMDILTKMAEVKSRGKSLSEVAQAFNLQYKPGTKPWKLPCDYAFPCATQNEIDLGAAQILSKNGVKGVFEGANMPCTQEAMEHFQQESILFGPGKAANAGGVAISALEMSQNSMRMSWSRAKVNEELQSIMKQIHDTCVIYGDSVGSGNNHPSKNVDYVKGANIGGFVKVANAMLAYGVH